MANIGTFTADKEGYTGTLRLYYRDAVKWLPAHNAAALQSGPK